MKKNSPTPSNSGKPGKHRDAGTGKYVTKTYADKNPKTTVKENDKKRKSG